MITFHHVSQADFNVAQFNIQGDGTSLVFKCNLSKPPFNVNFNGLLPSSVSVDGIGPLSVEATVDNTVDGDILTMTFGAAPSASAPIGPSLVFIYNSL